MSSNLLGDTVDIHGGGADLKFPHHESEIAQSEGATGQKPFVRLWMHTAMVGHEGEKMSKSLGNLVMVRDLLETWSPDALRIYLASHHYREPWEHDEGELNAAKELARKLRASTLAEGGSGRPLEIDEIESAFTAAMDEDLDTPAALTKLEELADNILLAAAAEHDVVAAQAVLRRLGRVFGLRLDQNAPEARVARGWERQLQRFPTD
jgi:cysteinyl-tRNA synthetase